MRKFVLLSIVIFVLVFGCSEPKKEAEKVDPKAPTESNFKAALEKHIATKTGRIAIGSFPKSIFSSDMFYERNKLILDEFVALGLASAEKTSKPKQGYDLKTRSMKDTDKKVFGTAYLLTDKGKSFYDEGKESFNYGKYALHEIIHFSAPTELMGKTVSEVKFKVKAVGVADWAKNSKALQKKNGNLRADIKSIETPTEGAAVLVLTNRGWIHEELF